MKLDELQKSVYRFITTPGSVNDALEAAGGESIPSELVLPSATLQPLERLMIYRRMYLLRMEEALAADYPVLQAFLGEEAFFQLVGRYVEQYPSRSYTLDRLGDQLIRFLETDPKVARRRRLVLDIARVEKAMVEVNEEGEDVAVKGQALANVHPDDYGRLAFRPIAALRFLELSYPIQPLLAAQREERTLPKVRPRAHAMVIWRQEYTMWRRVLEPKVARLLKALLGGQSMDEALAGAGRFSSTKLFATFQMFMEDGLFREFHLK